MSEKTYTVILHIVNNCDRFIGEKCYVASNQHDWQAAGELIGPIPPKGASITTVLQDIEEGELELKITRGSWATLQTSTDGKLLSPYSVDVQGDIEIALSIDGWRDAFPLSTASPQVHVLAENFYFPRLDQYKKVWIYLPENYGSSEKHYPVIYMHDGQHLFDEATSVGRAGPVEWMVDETIDEANHKAIVVGIAHAANVEDRERELLMHPFRNVERPLGEAYLADVVNLIKPYVDEVYRTKPDRSNTAMVGSSLGGLATLYAGMLYPHTFGTLGVFSPSIWTGKQELNQRFLQEIEKYREFFEDQRYYFYAGEKEKRRNETAKEPSMVSDMLAFTRLQEENISTNITIDIDPLGKHGALYWQKAFARFYRWWCKEIF